MSISLQSLEENEKLKTVIRNLKSHLGDYIQEIDDVLLQFFFFFNCFVKKILNYSDSEYTSDEEDNVVDDKVVKRKSVSRYIFYLFIH